MGEGSCTSHQHFVYLVLSSLEGGKGRKGGIYGCQRKWVGAKGNILKQSKMTERNRQGARSRGTYRL